ncbi:hypothetical protein I317_00177 [Kwoniella heveanensis CBS 569]|nr:hypothetical protein I317_00177 [Kwoniella heveanensis CBS 569]
MPYAEPTTPSPLPSPAKETPFHFHRKGHTTPPRHIEDVESGPSTATGPMPGIPRRSSSHSGSSTPRRAMLDNLSRATQAIHNSFPASRPMEGLPRRSPSSGPSSMPSVSGLPPAEGSSLGLKLHGSPVKSPLIHRGTRDLTASTSTVDSSLPSTPSDENPSHPVEVNGYTKDGQASVPFPSFDPDFKPPPRSHPRGLLSPNTRPVLSSHRRASAGHMRGGQGTTGSLQIPFTASTSDLNTGSAPMSPRPASMIRKKSGEVVKPSLKQRSMSTPDLTRQGDTSPTDEADGTRGFGEERSKSVRFADASEGDAKALESVVLFLREQKVTAVGKAADPDNAQFTDTETERDTDADAADFVQFRTRRNAAARAQDDGQIQLEGGSRIPRKRTDFSPDARGSLAGENVILERVELQSNLGPLSLRGSALVRNVSFQKWVAVRFTLDHWQTVSEVSGTHVCHIPAATSGDEGWDRFSFTIKLDDYKRKLDERQLILCIHYSVDGHDWWDSNDGMNYNFTFKKPVARRPTRMSTPPSLGAAYVRSIDSEENAPIPGLRRNNGPPPSSQINKAFGAPSTGPSNWVYPKLNQRLNVSTNLPSRPDSPAQTPPPNSFKAPAPPSAQTHLTLAKYCAPSPPQSPPKESSPIVPNVDLHIATAEIQRRASMNVMAGNYATLSPPEDMGHERRSSWNGQNNSWDSFSQAMDKNAEGLTPKADGDATPVAHASRSPNVGAEEQVETPEHKPLTLKRSTGDLRKLMRDAEESDTGLMTPPSSNLSSPPTPLHANLPPIPMSPAPSTSTGESSPVETMSNESTPDLSGGPIEVNSGGRGRFGDGNQKMTSQSYQDFLDKFCFFQSPKSTPNELEPKHSRPNHISISGNNSPGGFPFYGNNGHNSPRNTPTPTRQYQTAQDAFNFSADATPRPSVAAPGRPAQGSPNPANQSTASFHPSSANARLWNQQMRGNTASPSMIA